MKKQVLRNRKPFLQETAFDRVKTLICQFGKVLVLRISLKVPLICLTKQYLIRCFLKECWKVVISGHIRLVAKLYLNNITRWYFLNEIEGRKGSKTHPRLNSSKFAENYLWRIHQSLSFSAFIFLHQLLPVMHLYEGNAGYPAWVMDPDFHFPDSAIRNVLHEFCLCPIAFWVTLCLEQNSQ